MTMIEARPNPNQEAVYRNRRAVVRSDGPLWEVTYYTGLQRSLVLVWPGWEQALRQALNWTGLDL